MKSSRYNHLFSLDGTSYLVNALWRGVHAVDPPVITALSRLTSGDPSWATGLPDSHQAILQQNHYVIPNDFDEEQFLVAQRKQQQASKKVLALTIAPTLDCNFGCPYCFEVVKPQTRMSHHTIQALADFAKSRCTEETKQLAVTWFGGEPLMALPQIEAITQLLRDDLSRSHGLDYGATIITNGYGFTRKIAAKLRNLDVRMAQVTLDGTAEYHNKRRYLKTDHRETFDQIIDNITEARDVMPISIRVNLDHSNQEAFMPLVQLLRDRHLDVLVYPAFTQDIGKDQWEPTFCDMSAFLEAKARLFRLAPDLGESIFPFPKARRFFCGAQSEMFWVIAPDGLLHKCWDTIAEPHRAVGSVHSGIDDAAAAYWHSWGISNIKCRDCKVAPLCVGGCAADAIRANGEPQCYMSSEQLEYAIRALISRAGPTRDPLPQSDCPEHEGH